MVLKFNETIAVNEGLRSEIDVIRRERVTYSKVKSIMANEVGKISKETGEQEKIHISRSKAIEKIREKIIDLKGWNENEHSIYLSEFDKLQVKV